MLWVGLILLVFIGVVGAGGTWCSIEVRRMEREQNMTPDDLYKMGYDDGSAGKAMAASYMSDPHYKMGYEDGKGDRKIEKPSEDEYTDFNDAPEGFEFTGEKRVPEPYEFYLSKNGSPTYLTRARKNNQTRHILKCAECGEHSAFQGYAWRCTHHPEVKGRG